MKLEDLQKARITQQEFADGTQDVVQDEHGGGVAEPRRTRITKKSRGAWRGMTWFFLHGSRVVAGPVRRRITSKRPPLFVSEEWELLKTLRTDPEFKRSALVDSLTVQGIERTQLAAAQRQCRDQKAAYLGKLAEELGKDPRKELLEAEREDPDAFKVTKVDAVVRSLNHYELINRVLFRRVYNMV